MKVIFDLGDEIEMDSVHEIKGVVEVVYWNNDELYHKGFNDFVVVEDISDGKKQQRH